MVISWSARLGVAIRRPLATGFCSNHTVAKRDNRWGADQVLLKTNKMKRKKPGA